MGVPGFFSWLLKNKNKLGSKNIINENIAKVKYLMLDTNCLLHPCVNNIIQKYYDSLTNKTWLLYISNVQTSFPFKNERAYSIIGIIMY